MEAQLAQRTKEEVGLLVLFRQRSDFEGVSCFGVCLLVSLYASLSHLHVRMCGLTGKACVV